MSAENQQERPNYRLHCSWRSKDDGGTFNYNFIASDDDDARKKASSYIESLDKKYEGKQGDEWTSNVPLKLERISYVLKEVEEATRVSLEDDARDRAAKGPITLTDLANI